MKELTEKELERLPDNWDLRHNIHDLEYWFEGPEFDIQLVKTDYNQWEINELKGTCQHCGNPKGQTLTKNSLDSAFLRVESLTKGD